MKRNWLAFLGRAIAVTFIFAVVYEAIKELLNVYPQIKELSSSENLIIIVIVWLIIPVSVIGIFYGAFTYIRRGFDAPRLNWAKGLEQLAAVVGAIITAILLIVVFIAVVMDTGNIVVVLGIFILAGAVVFGVACILALAVESVMRSFRDKSDDED